VSPCFGRGTASLAVTRRLLHLRESSGSVSDGQLISYHFGCTRQSRLDEGFMPNLRINAVPPKRGYDQQLLSIMPLCNIGKAAIPAGVSRSFAHK